MPRPAFLTAFPKHLTGFLHEFSRHILKRPVVGICALAQTEDGRILLVRRGDTGGWALPGGTLEWGEQLHTALPRELEEETGATVVSVGEVRGIYSRPDRDFRFHAVTIVVKATVAEPIRGAKNAIEIRDVKLFHRDEIPRPLSMEMDDILNHALSDEPVKLE